MRATIAIATGVDWRLGGSVGLRRWVFPAAAPRSLHKTLRGHGDGRPRA